ncbi:MAG: transcription-repair coupling factor [Elusimicrobiota bacterium]|nr:transcription-repair coupling factor [Elusimicrobiota bacterium]
MKDELVQFWEKNPGLEEISEKIVNRAEKTKVSGLWGGSKAFFILALKERISQALLIIAEREDDLERLREDLKAFRGESSLFSQENTEDSLVSLYHLSAKKNPLLVTTIDSVKKKIISPSRFSLFTLTLSQGGKIEYQKISEKLTTAGYERVDIVEGVGEFSLRGEILDVWSPNLDRPLRVIFLEDRIEEMRQFDPLTQRSISTVVETKVIPAKLWEEKSRHTIFDYFPENVAVLLDNVEHPPSPGRRRFPEVYLSVLPQRNAINFSTKSPPSFHGKIGFFCQELADWRKEGWETYVFCNNEGEKSRLEELLREQKEEIFPHFRIGNLNSGFIFPALKLVVISEKEIFGRYKIRHRYPKLKYPARRLSDLIELNIGDYVVHERYGIGKYLGLKQIEVEERFTDYIAIEYAKGDKLYVPIEDFNLVEKYIGTEGYKPKLYSLDSTAWRQVTARVKKSVQRIARELLEVHAARQKLPGYAFPPDSHYEEEFADAFIYETTPDQERAIEEVKQDMTSRKPMDRIVCGDVGYGKTEVAMRAGLKAVFDGKQVAVLAPTTILVEQHYHTFSERFADYPVVIEMLSRFRSKKEQKEIIEKLKQGSVDVVIGTHRLLQKDIQFFDLGLVVIDEEQRFGVRHKEKLKQLRKTVDVLTLTATPIPRTLSMALGGVRDMSVIDTPPQGRIPVETYLGEYNEEIVEMAVRNEIGRGGQAFYVHNRVETIETVASRLRKMMPDVRMGVAHGKMAASGLEEVMVKFINKEYDLLVATTIVEAGLDIPNVNTMIITNGQELGLAQLYQLRGRIGRDKYKAYCYVFYPRRFPLSDIAEKRLETIAQCTELGSGFKIALRDLELRGAGNILGPEQHGHILEVGFDFYCKLLEEAVKSEKGIKIERELPVEIDLQVDAYIPMDYIADPAQRINIYRKFASAGDPQNLEKIKEELEDRYGNIPGPCLTLFELVELRQLAKRLGIEKISEIDGETQVEFSPQTQVPPDKFIELAEGLKEKIKFNQTEKFRISISPRDYPFGGKGNLKGKLDGERLKVRKLKGFLQRLI